MSEKSCNKDAIAEAIRYGLKYLGNTDAATPMGAIEAHGAAMLEAAEKIAGGLHAIAEAINEIDHTLMAGNATVRIDEPN